MDPFNKPAENVVMSAQQQFAAAVRLAGSGDRDPKSPSPSPEVPPLSDPSPGTPVQAPQSRHPSPGTPEPGDPPNQPAPMRDPPPTKPVPNLPGPANLQAATQVDALVVDPLGAKLLAEADRENRARPVPHSRKRINKMTDQSHTTELKHAIQNFEFKADVPVSIEDFESRDQWKSNVNESFDQMRDLVERQRQEIHSKVFAEVASQDASERDEIKQMRHADGRIAELMDVVKAHLASFALGAIDDGRDPNIEDGRGPNIEDQVLDLRNVSHELAACVLAQEDAVASWFAETFEPGA